jgi:hypothetical protein
MPASMRRAALAAFLMAAPLALAALQLPQGLKSQSLPLPGQTTSQSPPDAKDAVQFFSAGPIRVASRRPAEVDLRFRVADGLHINSHAPHDKSLIATRLMVVEGPGIRVTAVDFPAGSDYAVAFSKEKVNVYTGDFELQARVIAEPGEHHVAAKLRYQACDVNSCMPPRDLPIALDVIAR